MNPEEYRDWLSEQVESTCAWRLQKAVEDPEDERNDRSAAALGVLAVQLRGLPADHPKLIELLQFREDEDSEYVQEESQCLKRHGFHLDKPKDAEGFLSELIARLKGDFLGLTGG